MKNQEEETQIEEEYDVNMTFIVAALLILRKAKHCLPRSVDAVERKIVDLGILSTLH